MARTTIVILIILFRPQKCKSYSVYTIDIIKFDMPFSIGNIDEYFVFLPLIPKSYPASLTPSFGDDTLIYSR